MNIVWTTVFRYGFAVVSVLIAVGIRYALDPWMDLDVPFLTFFFAVMIATWCGGLGPGLLASALSTLAADFFFIEPVYHFAWHKGGIIPLIIFVLETTMIAIISGKQNVLRQHESRFMALFQQSIAGMAETDLTGRFIQVNHIYCQIVGRSRQELYRLRIQDITHPDDLSNTSARVEELVERAAPPFTSEKRYLRPDGQVVWVSKSISLVRDKKGQPQSIVVVAFDTTERKQAEDALRESEVRFRRMANTAPVLVWVSDTHKLCTWFNKPWLEYTGRTMEQELGNGWADGVHPDDLERCLTTYVTAFDNRRPFTMEYRLRRYDGHYHWLLDTGVPCLSENATFTGYIGSCIDISELKRVEHTLHETNTRLNALSTHLERLVEERTAALVQSEARLRALATDLNLTEQKERKRLANELHDHLAQLLVLGRIKLTQIRRVDGINLAGVFAELEGVFNTSLDYIRTMVADLCPPVLYEFGLSTALKWLADHMRRQALIVTTDLCDTKDLNLPEDQAVLLFQSARELLINVKKHAATDIAHVRLHRADRRLYLQVRDDGMGFNVEAVETHHEMSFSHFGLFSIRERMKALGGSFDIQTRPGLGTTATMTLPLTVEARARVMGESSIGSEIGKTESNLSTPSDQDVKNGTTSRIRVLLVDDHTMVRQGLRSLLETYPDIEVVGEASDGQQALICAASLQPSVVVMDINMPKMNGVTATASITARFPRIVIIGLSVNAECENQEAMNAAGAAVLLMKESAVEHLHGAILQAIETRTAGKPSYRAKEGQRMEDL